jgi:hypothetical protein
MIEKLLSMYRSQIFPLVKAAGFEGKAEKAVKRIGRGVFEARARELTGKDEKGDLWVFIGGEFGESSETFLSETFKARSNNPRRVIADIERKVQEALQKLANLNIDPAVVETKDIAEALRALLERTTKSLPGVSVERIETLGREFVVHVRGHVEPVRADRTALLSLLRPLYGDEPFTRNVGARGRELLRWDPNETLVYLECLSKIDPDEARAVFVHLFGAYAIPLPKDNRLGGLFPKALFATKHLVEASSAGAMLKKAIPHALEGSLIDRVAALQMIDAAVSQVNNHRDRDELLASLKQLVTKLSNDASPLIREAGWLLQLRLG